MGLTDRYILFSTVVWFLVTFISFYNFFISNQDFLQILKNLKFRKKKLLKATNTLIMLDSLNPLLKLNHKIVSAWVTLWSKELNKIFTSFLPFLSEEEFLLIKECLDTFSKNLIEASLLIGVKPIVIVLLLVLHLFTTIMLFYINSKKYKKLIWLIYIFVCINFQLFTFLSIFLLFFFNSTLNIVYTKVYLHTVLFVLYGVVSNIVIITLFILSFELVLKFKNLIKFFGYVNIYLLIILFLFLVPINDLSLFLIIESAGLGILLLVRYFQTKVFSKRKILKKVLEYRFYNSLILIFCLRFFFCVFYLKLLMFFY